MVGNPLVHSWLVVACTATVSVSCLGHDEPCVPLARVTETTSSDTAVRVIEAFQHIRALGIGRPLVIPIPSQPNLMLLAAASMEPEGYQAFRLWLLRAVHGAFKLADSSEHLGDAEWLTPNVFEHGEDLLILADHGSEYSWGLLAFTVENGALERLPFPRMAGIATGDAANLTGPGSNVLPDLSVYWEDHEFVVEFPGDLLEDPGARTQRLWCRTGGQLIVIRGLHDAWRIENAVPHVSNPVDESRWICGS